MVKRVAIFTTEGADKGWLNPPIDEDKIREVAGGVGHFTCLEDTRLAEWIVKVFLDIPRDSGD